jgi:putative addiction module component (TIGR02574 family)
VVVTTAAERVLKDALALSDEEREELVAALTQTLAPIDLDPAWKAELARRIAKIESGEAILHDAELHATQLRAKYE